jgi:hypothetical protein
MRRSILAVPAVLVLGLSACGGGGYETKTVKATESDSGGDFGFSDAAPKTKVGKQGPEQLSPGDTLSFRSDLFQGKKTVGSVGATCTATHGGRFDTGLFQCQGTATLPKGQLVLNVAGHIGGATRGAIVGGTGDYKGAGGTFESLDQANGGSKDTFNIQIPKK